MPFKDRKNAGIKLAHALKSYQDRPDVVVVGLSCGGVPVAAQVAEILRVPLDIMVVRKLGTPGHEELAMGAIATGGIQVLNEEVVGALDIDNETIAGVAERQRIELERREFFYRGKHDRISLKNCTVILVDDGLATGTTMLAALKAAQMKGASMLVVAVPVAPPDTVHLLRHAADDVICLKTPVTFSGVGMWYANFSQVTDEEVVELLEHVRSGSNKIKKE